MASSKTYTPGANYQGSKIEALPVQFAYSPVMLGGPITAGGYVPTVALAAGAGTVGSVTGQAGYDMAGSFNLVMGTAALTGGTIATLTFGQALAATPSAVIVTAAPNAGTVSYAVGVTAASKTGFSIFGSNPTSGGTYGVNYMVFR
jgi:hypothetical protein